MPRESLKNCPFCGSAARAYDGKMDAYGVVCTKCGVKLYGKNSTAAATRAWNSRAENADDTFKLMGVMHSVDKWLDGDELKQDEVNRAATMREKTLDIIEGQQREIRKLEEALARSLPSYCQIMNEKEYIALGRKYATEDLLKEIRHRLPTQREFHSSDIQMGYTWAIAEVSRLLCQIEQEKPQEVSDDKRNV